MSRPRITIPRPRVALPSRQRLASGWRNAVSGAVNVARALSAAREQVSAAWDGGRARRRVVGGIAEPAQSPDDVGFRSLSGGAAHWELTPDARRKLIDVAGQLYRSNPLVKSATDIGVSFVVGDGITVTSEDPVVQAVIDRHWFDQTFEYWPTAQVSRVRILGLTGMLLLRRTKDPDGVTRLKYVSPARVATYRLDPENGATIIGVELVGDRPTQKVTLRTIITGNESAALSEKARKLREKWPDGVFVCNVNQIEPGDMGIPDCASGFEVADWLTTFLETTLAAVEYQSNVVADIEIKGLTPEGLLEAQNGRLKNPPRPGVPYIHNELEQLNWKSPDLKAPDRAALFGMFLNQFCRSARIAPFMLAHPDDTNRATAMAEGSPVMRGFSERQALVARFIEQIIDDQLRWAEKCGQLPAGTSLKRGLYTVNVSPVSQEDAVAQSGTLNAIVMALNGALAQGLLSYETAVTVCAAAVKTTMGIEIDAAKEIETMLGRGRSPAMGYWPAGAPENATPEAPAAPATQTQAPDPQAAVEQTRDAVQAGRAEAHVTRAYAHKRAPKAVPALGM